MELVGQEHWLLVRDYGLVIASAGGHQSLTDGLNKRENHLRDEQEMWANLRLAEKWGVPLLICFSGNREGVDDYTGAIYPADGLLQAARAAEDA